MASTSIDQSQTPAPVRESSTKEKMSRENTINNQEVVGVIFYAGGQIYFFINWFK